MADRHPSMQATSEPDRLEPGKSESPPKPMCSGLCIDCQTLVFNERDHSDTWIDHGYRLVWDDNGNLKLEIERDRAFDIAGAMRYRISGWEIPLRNQHTREDIIPDLPSIRATAEAGCRFCKCLLSSDLKARAAQEFKEFCDPKSGEITITIEFFYTWAQSSSGIFNLVAVTAIDTEPKYGILNFFLVEADLASPCAEMLGIRTNTFLPMWSFDEKMAVMRNWIAHCKSRCHPETLDRTLPTRLLDLDSSRGGSQDVRLVYSKDVPRSNGCEYAALSHCWGSPDRPPLETQTTSLDNMLRNIPFESLPANYRDAVHVVRGLGIGYLWIDSLCIVQDSLEDWERESLRMVDVYEQAHVTIIVATGNCCHDGFLNPKVDQRVQIPYSSSMASSTIKDTYYLREDYDTNQDILDSTWNQRGWTLQENSFSPRRLYFTKNSFSFSCDSDLHLMDGKTARADKLETAESSLTHAGMSAGYHYELVTPHRTLQSTPFDLQPGPTPGNIGMGPTHQPKNE